jgi:hypothetical protein
MIVSRSMVLQARLAFALMLLSGCAGQAIQEEGDPDDVLRGADETGTGSTVLAPGGKARVTADSLNLRDGVGTGANILTAMPCGAQVLVLAGPSTTPSAGWWNLTYGQETGWASGKYLIAEASFTDALCGGGAPSDGGTISGSTPADIFARAKLAVGFSYYWGHGSWRADHTQLGSCSGSCPSCTHTGQYGADCSGFIAKVWQVPSPSALEADQHPYSTYNFYNETHHWKPVPRSSMQPADAVVRRSASAGHIALVEEASDPFGDVWLYEARACGIGIVRNLRAVDSTYIVIRRDGL